MSRPMFVMLNGVMIIGMTEDVQGPGDVILERPATFFVETVPTGVVVNGQRGAEMRVRMMPFYDLPRLVVNPQMVAASVELSPEYGFGKLYEGFLKDTPKIPH